MAMTVAQQRALALAAARLRLQQQTPPAANQGVTAAQMAASENLPIPGTPMHEAKPAEPSMVPWLDPVTAFANSAVDAIPVAGPTLTNMAQNADALTNSVVTGQPYDFDRSWQERAGVNSDLASQYPEASTAGSIAGAVAPLIGVGMTKPGGQALGLTGTTAQRAGMGLVSGAALGGADAAARGNDAVAAALMGGGLGGIFPLAERALSPVVQALMGQKIPGYVQTLGRNLERDGINPSQMIGQTDAIGADAMLMDLGPNMTRQAGAIASLPGEGQTALRNALLERRLAAPSRIKADVNTSLGPATSPRAYEAGIAEAKSQLSPVYEQAFANAKAVDTAPIALNLESAAVNLRGEAQNVATSLRGMLDVAGNPGNLDPNPRTLFEIRKAIDGMFGTVQDGNARRLLTETRRLVDDELASKVPGIKAADAEYKKLAESSSAFEQGQQALDSGRSAMTPSDLSGVAASSPAHVLEAMSQGTRSEIDRVIGTKGYDIEGLRSAIKGDGSWNHDRLVTLFGAKKADELYGILDREMTYQRSYNTVTQNSETAARTAAQKEAAPRQFGQQSTSIADLLMKVPQGLANMGARTRSESVNRKVAEALMSRPTPELVDQIIAARRMNRGRIGSSLVPLITNQ